MAKPATFLVHWLDALYGPEIKARLDEVLTSNRLAVVNRIYAGSTPFDITDRHELSGAARLERQSGRIVCQARQPVFPILAEGHHYRRGLWQGLEEGDAFRILLLKHCVIVIPEKAKDRTKAQLETTGLAILKRPASHHEALALSSNVKANREVFEWIWPGGLRFRDVEGLLPPALLAS